MRGSSWQIAIRSAMARMPDKGKAILTSALMEGLRELGEKPDAFGL